MKIRLWETKSQLMWLFHSANLTCTTRLDYQNFKLMIGFICLSTTIIHTCKVGTGNECKQNLIFSHKDLFIVGCEGDENFQVVPGSYMAHIIHIREEGVSKSYFLWTLKDKCTYASKARKRGGITNHVP